MAKRLIFFILLFIAIRSIHYIYHMNWSGDQASYAIEALRIFKEKSITLIGPQISANYEGRFIFQGPVTYYLFIVFLVLGKWDPVIASYLFVLFSSIMIVPLYLGVRKLIHEKAAWIMVIVYTLVPYYIDYTRFLWNSTLQFSLIPILIFLMGYANLFFVSIWLGILLQFHYQFILVIAAIFVYYFFIKKLKPSYLIHFMGGIAIGFSPLIIFELRHNFYHINTILLFVTHWDKVDRPGGITMPHYYISILFMLIVMVFGVLRKFVNKLRYLDILVFALIVAGYAISVNGKLPQHAFWAPTTPWNYLVEKKIYDIIRSTHLTTSFNIANLAYYDTKSYVVKYFMKRDGYKINYDDYYGNRYLFVVSEGTKYLTNPSYEVATFNPYKRIKRWNINSRYNMVLLERE